MRDVVRLTDGRVRVPAALSSCPVDFDRPPIRSNLYRAAHVIDVQAVVWTAVRTVEPRGPIGMNAIMRK